MLSITLTVNEEEKKFVTPFIKGRALREALRMNKTFQEKDLSEETADQLVDFVCMVFNNQFTPDDVWDGMPLEGLLPNLKNVFFEVVDQATKNVEGVPGGKK